MSEETKKLPPAAFDAVEQKRNQIMQELEAVLAKYGVKDCVIGAWVPMPEAAAIEGCPTDILVEIIQSSSLLLFSHLATDLTVNSRKRMLGMSQREAWEFEYDGKVTTQLEGNEKGLKLDPRLNYAWNTSEGQS